MIGVLRFALGAALRDLVGNGLNRRVAVLHRGDERVAQHAHREPADGAVVADAAITDAHHRELRQLLLFGPSLRGRDLLHLVRSRGPGQHGRAHRCQGYEYHQPHCDHPADARNPYRLPHVDHSIPLPIGSIKPIHDHPTPVRRPTGGRDHRQPARSGPLRLTGTATHGPHLLNPEGCVDTDPSATLSGPQNRS